MSSPSLPWAAFARPHPVRTLAGANLAAQSAEQLSLAAVPLVAVLLLGAGPGATGALAAAQSLPFLLLSLPLGVLADRVPRRRLLLASEALRAVSLLLLLALLLGERLSLAALAVLGFLGAAGTVGFSIAAPALLPGLVPRERLPGANARLELARSAAFAAGPALAGALVAWAGAGSAFGLALLLSLLALASMRRLAEPVRAAPAARAALRELREGAAFVWRQPLLRPMLLTGVAWNLAWFTLQAVYVPYALRGLGLGAQAVGLTLAAYGAGMVLGALLAGRLAAALPFGRAIQLGPVVSVLAALAMVATLALPHAGLAALSFFLFGAGPVVWTITSTTLRQHLAPEAMLGRVSALFLAANAGARPLGAALGGAVGAAWGEPACLWLALAGFALQAAVILASRVGGLRRLGDAA